MRVVQVLGSSAGGVARHVAQVTAELTAAGEQVLVAGPSSVRSTVLGDGGRFVPVEIADRPHASDLVAIRELARAARDADVVHAHGLRAGALTVLAVRRRTRVVVTLHNLPVGGRAIRTVSAVLGRVVARGADVVLGVSGDLVALARSQGARRAERALVPAPARREPGQTPAQTRAELGLAADTPLAVTVARLAPQKGLDTLVRAASGVTVPGFVWLLAGDGPLESEVRAQAESSGAPVRVLGRREDVPELIAAADVVVSTAVWEGQPLAVQEALGLGAAVVATDAGGTREVTEDAAVLVPVGDDDALATAIRDVLTDHDQRERLRAAARDRVAQLPTPADVLTQLRSIYRV
ncbi:glycosyltransferase family 4 protein [Cellulomonas sp. NPDC089187]|uniref:glycosyltransferase family 4 protein n=1 Tax=Cellulomonas sp. NPDC089187 TaxID=3154970 RepID=UPI0034465957